MNQHISGLYWATRVGGKRKKVHRIIAEKALGKPLPSGAQVHHVDEDKLNNSNSNLVICPNEEYHQLIHRRTKVYDLGGDPNKDKWCNYHNTVHSKGEFGKDKSRWDGLNKMCRTAQNEYQQERRAT